MPFPRLLLGLALTSALLLSAPIQAASADNNVEWGGVSHISWLDREPLCPVDNEAFTVKFQTYRNDLTGARIRLDDGGITFVDAAVTATRGPYDVWTALVPATSQAQISYVVELLDGSDVDYLGPDGPADTIPGTEFEMDFNTLAHAPVGATPLPGGGVVFKVWSPDRASAHVRGQFNGWGTADPMTRVGEYFVGRVAGAAAGQMYKYYFSGGKWTPDARARRLNPTDNYNTFVVDPQSYQWQVTDFDVPDFEQMVIYQLHVGTFAGRNDPYGSAPFPARFADVTARVEHLAELGVNAVMLNPITEFPGDRSAGYNPISQYATEWIYGQPDDFKEMVDTLHAHGIAVLLDIVWNHFSSTDNFLWWYDGTQIYFDDPAVGTPWGDQSDFDNPYVRDYFADSALAWLDEYRLDGFRMDATGYMNVAPQDASGWSLMQRLNNEMDQRAVDKIAIAEQLPDNSWVTRPTGLGGAGFDSQYHDEFTDRLRDEIFDASLGDPEMWKIRNIINGSGEYLFGRYVTNYLELHDECWPTSGGQRIVKTIDTVAPHDDQYAAGRSKLAQGLVLTAPGIPAMLQGTEWLDDTDFGTDEGNRIDWSKKFTYSGVFAYYRDLINLRTSSGALRADAGVQVFHLNESGNVIAFQRWDLDGTVHVVLANFSNTDYTSYRIGLPVGGTWREDINSQNPLYQGDGPINSGDLNAEGIGADGFGQSVSIGLPAMGLVVLTSGGVSAVPDESAPPTAGLTLTRTYPNPFNPRLNVEFELKDAATVHATIVDVKGRTLRTLTVRRFEGGSHRLVWDGKDDAGSAQASGAYLLRLAAGSTLITEKVLLVR
jgi:1,4-alpha-glucan branching enzyme